jgi:hypothetical protein
MVRMRATAGTLAEVPATVSTQSLAACRSMVSRGIIGNGFAAAMHEMGGQMPCRRTRPNTQNTIQMRQPWSFLSWPLAGWTMPAEDLPAAPRPIFSATFLASLCVIIPRRPYLVDVYYITSGQPFSTPITARVAPPPQPNCRCLIL